MSKELAATVNAVTEIESILEEMHSDEDKLESGVKKAIRRTRQNFMTIIKLCKTARIEIPSPGKSKTE